LKPFLIVLALAFALPAASQTPLAVVRGVVRDPSSSPLAGVGLVLVQEETNQRRAAITDDRGQFVLPAVPPGEHRLEIEHAGYR